MSFYKNACFNIEINFTRYGLVIDDYDIAIVGSGTSGGCLAYYLNKAGFHCLLVEAGRSFSANTFPGNEMDYTTQLFWNGGMDVSMDGRLIFLRGKCLGGGSVINQCDLDRFDDIALLDWKEASGVTFFTNEGMIRHYEEVEKHLVIQEIPKNHWNRNARIFAEGFERLGFRWSPLARGQSDCAIEEGNDCIVCLGGCPRDSKQSVLVTFLKQAKRNGLEIWPEFETENIQNIKEGVKIAGRRNGHYIEVFARNCVLAAGALGTTHLLLKSGYGEKLPSLGERFFCHPQMMNFGVFDEKVNSHKGVLQAVKSDDIRIRKKGFKLENVFAPPISLAMLVPGFGKKHQAWMQKYTHMACIEVAIRDVGKGKLTIDRRGKLKINKVLSKEDQRRARQGQKLVREIFEAMHAKEILQSNFMFGLHLMGGCAMGIDPSSSIVDGNFKVHGCQNLFIADSSIFPSAPGINPALTIMALAHRASKAITNAGRFHTDRQ